MKRPHLYFLVTLLLVNNLAYSHGGGLDKNGGHFNRQTGEYHCHREPCLSNRKKVEDATNAANRSSYSTLYNREDWEQWIDEDGDCQDTRAEILIRDSQQPVSLGSGGCEVTRGLWVLPYTGQTVGDPAQIDIDHIIPLKWAHGHGGDRWAPAKKRSFANDPENLLAASISANRAKGSKGPDDWMPAINRCGYAKRWERLLVKYELEAMRQERDALAHACDSIR